MEERGKHAWVARVRRMNWEEFQTLGLVRQEVQPKLLRALQEKSFERLGGTRTIPIDVRLVAATNRNLAQMARAFVLRAESHKTENSSRPNVE